MSLSKKNDMERPLHECKKTWEMWKPERVITTVLSHSEVLFRRKEEREDRKQLCVVPEDTLNVGCVSSIPEFKSSSHKETTKVIVLALHGKRSWK